MSHQPLPPKVLQQIDDVCDAFERAWRSGESPKIETFLEQGVEPRGEYLRELLAREFELRREAGEEIDVTEYEKRFEGYLDLVRTLLIEPEPEIITGERESVDTGHGITSGHVGDLEKTDASTMPYFFEIGPTKIKSRCEPALPARIGRFRPLRRLGRGNFDVYLADDELTGTQVALKVTRADDPFSRRRMTSLAAEAQRMAGLEHPGIVKVHEFIIPTGPRTGDSAGADGFIVLEYVDGQTLEALLESAARPSLRSLVEMLAEVADAVHHAHLAGMVHRDLKPSNILIDRQGRPRVCDFGLAIKFDWARMMPGQVAGTLFYMAPEQVRGQTSNLDGRTDVWALGVILYRVLTGRLPFWGNNASECFEEILQHEPRPPRQMSAEVPRPLERICLRSLGKSLGDRYLTAEDFAEDLRRWLSQANDSSGHEPPSLVMPRGLRPFGSDQSGSFPSLLPGPRDAEGLPESIRFWKARIEADVGTAPFTVGLIHGPCGAGKTSFVRAGLLPRLDRREIRVIEVTCESTGTEARLLQALKALSPAIPRESGLDGTISILESDPSLAGQKLLIVVDQFERCLLGPAIEPFAELLRALSLGDGHRVQALLVVRDPFWIRVRGLLQSQGIPVIEGENAAAVEPFDAPHARGVLKRIGRSLQPLSETQPNLDSFLDQVVPGLAGERGTISPLRIAVFVEAMRQSPWTLESLAAVGGVEGIERRYVGSELDARTTSPEAGLRREALVPVVRRLLAETEEGGPGPSYSGRRLREDSGYMEGDPEFTELIRTLDEDLKLIASVPSRQGKVVELDTSRSFAPIESTHYRVAHEFLVSPLLHWTSRQPREAHIGPAYARLRALTTNWRANPSAAERVPTLMDLLRIRRGSRPADWTDAEYRFMSMAFWHHAQRIVLMLVPILALAILAWCLSWK